MKLLVITGPSGSGKTYLANKLASYFKHSITINTDSYYRDNLFIKLLSKYIISIYDRIISIKKREIIKTIKSISNSEKDIIFYFYDYKRKKSTKELKTLEMKNEKSFIILEGIFAHRLNLDYINSINILCKAEKNLCYKRRMERDLLERSENILEVNKKFDKSWFLYKKNINAFKLSNQVDEINPFDPISYQQLINKLDNYVIKKTKDNN